MRAFCFLIAVLPSLATAQSQVGGSAWLPGHNWSVVCREAGRAAFGAAAAQECDDTNPAGLASFHRTALQEASAWLDNMGFHGPSVLLDDVRTQHYAAFVDPSQIAAGSIATYKSGQAALFLSPGFRTPTPEATERQRRLVASDNLSAVHELFHGVQSQYARDPDVGWSIAEYDGEDRDWIWEGTARAVQLEWGRISGATGPLQSTPFHVDRPLYAPDRSRRDHYNTARLWRFIPSLLGQSGRDRIGYLHDVLRGDLGQRNGVKGVDYALQDLGLEKGLSDAFTEYIAREASDEEHFSEHETLTIQASGAPTTNRVSGSTRGLAASGFALTFRVSGPGLAGVSIRIDGEEENEQLRLVVGDQRYDDRDVLAPEEPRNTFRGVAEPGEREVWVRVVNAAPEAEDSISDAPLSYTLVIETTPVASCSDDAMKAAVSGYTRWVNQSMRAAVGMVGGVDYEPMRFEGAEPGYGPGEGTLSVSGLVNGGRVGCAFNLGQVSLIGQAMTGAISEDTAVATMESRAQDMERAMQALPPRLRRAMETGEEPANMTPAEMRAMQEFARGLGGFGDATEPEQAKAVIQVFSPNMMTFTGGMLAPLVHGANQPVGGWRKNESADVVLLFDSATPADLRAGQTYPVSALALGQESDLEEQGLPQVAAMGGFYAAWDGFFTSDLLFEGESVHVSGRLEGTVTVTRITGNAVEGEFSVQGVGLRRSEQWKIVDGDDGPKSEQVSESQRQGPLTISGTFRAPAQTDGGGGVSGYTTVSLSSRR